ncbi:MAG: excinuclease ABC subunit UvrA [Bacteroidales bacterium]|nr:excinuclease ABC subunit UvrA [Bacteroidales bacterium]
MDFIEITNASVHNLKQVSLKIPRHALVVVTGLSGSGKSSLAFDTIFAEAQRRYMDTLSAYARHYIGVMERPSIESITGLSPTIAIEQKATNRNPRSTVGTVTEIADFLRLLFSRIAKGYSPATGAEMVRYTDAQIVDLVISKYASRRCVVLAPLVKGRKGHYRELFESMMRRGYSKMRIDGNIVDITDVAGGVDRYKAHFIDLVVDRLVPSGDDAKRVRDAVTLALNYGKGSLSILDAEDGSTAHFSKHFICPDTGISLPEPAPHTFSFNSPQGACPHCKGLGVISQVDMEKIIPNPSLSIAQGGIAPIGPKKDNNMFAMLEALAAKNEFSLFDPISTLSDETISLLMYGSEDLIRVNTYAGLSEMVTFPGILSKLEHHSQESDESFDRKERYAVENVCPVCHGSRLNQDALCFKIDGFDIAQLCAMDVVDLLEWVHQLPSRLSEKERNIGHDILKELEERIGFLVDVGLGYLSLDRPTRSLSGGESQRIRLATQIGSKLVNVLYILDEPSIGLHASDNLKLIASLQRLRDEGNSVMVVEHDEAMMKAADWIVDLGPGAGEHGGKVLYSGPLEGIASVRETSLTAQYLLGDKKIEPPKQIRQGSGHSLVLRGARGHNLKNVTVSFPLGTFIGVCGVSGSGKSSLIADTLMPIISKKLYRSLQDPLPYDSIEGLEHIDKLVVVDQSPIGRSPRSNPATYTGVLTPIRQLFEQTPDAKIRGLKSNIFSFNVKGGRCEVCKGAGVEIIEMNFLPSVQVCCKECGGKRFKPDVLSVRYKGKNISEVLDMTISEAVDFFDSVPSIAGKLRSLKDVGLGYIRLGQSSLTLSGGENQRVKLAAELSRSATGHTLFILDEPTTGLHTDDIRVLLEVLSHLVDQGNTVIIIEHNEDVLRSVDHLIELGPGGGRYGGQVI